MKAWVQTLVVLVGLAAALRGADAIPTALAGLPRGAVNVGTLDEAQRFSGMELRLPQAISARYQPQEIVALPPPAAGLRIRLRPMAGGHGFSLFRLTSAKRAQALLSPLSTFDEIGVQVAGRPARLRSLRDLDGTVTQELDWQDRVRTVVRFQGPTLELLSLGEQLARELP